MKDAIRTCWTVIGAVGSTLAVVGGIVLWILSRQDRRWREERETVAERMTLAGFDEWLDREHAAGRI